MIDYMNRRLAERRPMIAPAVLTFEDDRTVACSTVDISTGGVKLLFPQDITLPDNFRVTIASTRVRNRRARMVWRNRGELGIRFV